MSVILADDFQQMGRNGNVATRFGYFAPAVTTQAILQTIEAMGYTLPAATSNTALGSYPVVLYDTINKALAVSRLSGGVSHEGLMGLRRSITYQGDILCINFLLEFNTEQLSTGVFFDVDGLYQLGVNAAGNYTFNNTELSYLARYPVNTKIFHELIFTATHVEVWLGNTMVHREARPNADVIKTFTFGFVANPANWSMWLHSLIVADNDGTYLGRIGRRVAATYSVSSITTQGTTLTTISSTELEVINRFASTKQQETGDYGLGNLVSPYAGASATLTSVKTSNRNISACCVNFQAKRREPSDDRLGIHPFISVAGVKTYGAHKEVGSLWKNYSVLVPITGLTDLSFTLGYEQAIST